MMSKKTANKTLKEQPTPVQTAALATEQYKRTESGFVLVKTSRNGSVTEIPLSNFSAEIIAEFQREYEYTPGTKRIAVDRLLVKAQFENSTREIPFEPSRFNDSLIDEVLKVHPRAFVNPGKEKHVIAAIKTLSSPRIILKGSQADSKNNNNLNRR